MACTKKLSVLLVLAAFRLSRIYAFLATPIGEANHHVGACETAFRTFSVPRKDDSDVGGMNAEEVTLKNIQAQLQTQKEQIDKLASAWANSLQNPSTSGGVTPTAEPPQQLVPPLKAMLFIDGTWLYYSVHERGPRDCPLIAQFGRGWQRRYAIDWRVLPSIVNRHLTKAVRRFSERPLEIVRSSVFTSYKANTSPTSYRFKLFEDLQNANYDVHMMETVGKSEKCVDIQLAVEMLHHATDSGGSYDIAILLTGDKDFIPAIIRTRQKGKLFSLVSMRAGCNRALVDLPGMRDFDVLWLDDHLDELVFEREQANAPNAQLSMDEFTVNKVIHDFIQHSGFEKVSSRDLGRYLKHHSISGLTFLDAIKEGYGSLYHYLASDEAYIVTHDVQKEDSNFWISLSSDGDRRMNELAREAKISTAEKAFFSSYSTDALEMAKEEIYTRSLVQDASYHDSESAILNIPAIHPPVHPADFAAAGSIPEPTSRYEESSTKEVLKKACRELELKVSGTKAELLERLRAFEKQIPDHPEGSEAPVVDDETVLVATVVEFLRANGGKVGSRNMGRYLAANRGRHARTALLDLKQRFGTLKSFLGNYPHKFETNFIVGETNEFEIVLK